MSPFRTCFISHWSSSNPLGHPNVTTNIWAHFTFCFEGQGLTSGAKLWTILLYQPLWVTPQNFLSGCHLRIDTLGSVSEASPKPGKQGTSATGLRPQVAAFLTLLQQLHCCISLVVWKKARKTKLRFLHSGRQLHTGNMHQAIHPYVGDLSPVSPLSAGNPYLISAEWGLSLLPRAGCRHKGLSPRSKETCLLISRI